MLYKFTYQMQCNAKFICMALKYCAVQCTLCTYFGDLDGVDFFLEGPPLPPVSSDSASGWDTWYAAIICKNWWKHSEKQVLVIIYICQGKFSFA